MIVIIAYILVGGQKCGEEKEQFISDFSNIICKVTENKTYSNIIFLCIGTDRITGDAFRTYCWL